MRLLLLVLIYGLLLDGPAQAAKGDIAADLKSIQSGYSPETCEKVLDGLDLDFDPASLKNISGNETGRLQSLAKQQIQDSWNLRLALHQKLDVSSKACAIKIREIFHRLRDTEDYLAEFAFPAMPALDPKSLDFQAQPVPIFDRKAYPDYFVRKDLDQSPFQFRSGDLMLARGVSFVSAIITQVSDNHSHFSHVVTVRMTPNNPVQTKDDATVESYIGSGVGKFDLVFALKNENARLLVLRPKDKELGQKAADQAMIAADKKLPYDYEMNYEDGQAMSCVEVPVTAYKNASGGRLDLPIFPSMVSIKNQDFLTRMHLRIGSIRTPDDLEIDPNFEMVLDWKDLRLIRDSRHKDAVLAEMVRWISDLKYNFHDNWKSYVAMYVIKPMRSTFLWPWFKKWTSAPNIDKEVPRGTFGLMVLIDQVGEVLLKEVRARDEAFRLAKNRPMTNRELRETLEAFRKTELAAREAGKKSPLLEMLRPN